MLWVNISLFDLSKINVFFVNFENNLGIITIKLYLLSKFRNIVNKSKKRYKYFYKMFSS